MGSAGSDVVGLIGFFSSARQEHDAWRIAKQVPLRPLLAAGKYRPWAQIWLRCEQAQRYLFATKLGQNRVSLKHHARPTSVAAGSPCSVLQLNRQEGPVYSEPANIGANGLDAI